MTQGELDALFTGLRGKLEELGLPLSREIAPQPVVNTRAKRRLGCCIRREGRFTIQVSQSILGDPQLLRATLVHELLHTCYGCQNHGKRWKAYAQTAGEALGLSITRTVKAEGESQPLRREEMKYFLRCEQCGAVIGRYRMCKLVKYPGATAAPPAGESSSGSPRPPRKKRAPDGAPFFHWEALPPKGVRETAVSLPRQGGSLPKQEKWVRGPRKCSREKRAPDGAPFLPPGGVVPAKGHERGRAPFGGGVLFKKEKRARGGRAKGPYPQKKSPPAGGSWFTRTRGLPGPGTPGR